MKERLVKYEYNRYKQYRIHKSRSRRRHRYYRHYLFEFNSNLEEDNSPRVSFMYIKDTRPFLNLYKRYRAVDIKYFKQIFFKTFKFENLTKLSREYVNRADTDDA